MLYPEIYEESLKAINDGNPELAEFADWLHLKSYLLGYFPQSLKHSKKLLDWCQAKHRTGQLSWIYLAEELLDGLCRIVWVQNWSSMP